MMKKLLFLVVLVLIAMATLGDALSFSYGGSDGIDFLSNYQGDVITFYKGEETHGVHWVTTWDFSPIEGADFNLWQEHIRTHISILRSLGAIIDAPV